MKLFSPKWIIVALCIGATACTHPSANLTVTNSAPVERTDELVVLKREILEPKLGNIPAGKYVAIKDAKGENMLVQFDDTDADGVWDEAVFLYTFPVTGKEIFSLSLTSEGTDSKAVARAHVRHRKKNADDSFGPIIKKDEMPPGNLPLDSSKLIAGIANSFNNTMKRFEKDGAAVLLTHGVQSENKDWLGLAIIVPAKDFAGFGMAPDQNSDIMNTYTIAQHINNLPLTYRFYFAWEKTSKDFANIGSFQSFMEKEAIKFSHPLELDGN